MPSRTMGTSAIFAFFILFLFSGLSLASTSTSGSIEYSLKGIQTTTLPDLRQYPSGTPRKKAFLNAIVPAIDQHNREIMRERTWLLERRYTKNWRASDINKLKQICKSYGMTCSSPSKTNWDSLLSRVDILPTHFVATQAATESGWGTSKLAQANNNLFGMRCGRNCNSGTGNVKGYYAYQSVDKAIESYMKNLNTHKAYASLRDARAKQRVQPGKILNTPKLINELDGYSHLGSSYNKYLLNMFNSNKSLITQAQNLAKTQRS